MDLLKELMGIRAELKVLKDKVEKTEIKESKNEYEDSGEFTDEMVTASGKIDDIKKIINAVKWKNWMKITDENFNVNVSEVNHKMTAAFKKFEDAYHKLEDEIDKAA